MSTYQTLVNLVAKSSLYPPSEICSGTYGKKEAVKEKRLMEICESLYRLDNQTVPLMRDMFREYDITVGMSLNSNIRVEYIASVAGKFLFRLEKAIKDLDTMHKKDPALAEYYKTFSVPRKNAEIIVRSESLRMANKTISAYGLDFTDQDVHTMINEAIKEAKENNK